MKEILKNSFSFKTLEPFILGIGSVLLMELLIFPGLSVANTFINFISAVGLVGFLIFIIKYLKFKLWDSTDTDGIESKDKKNN